MPNITKLKLQDDILYTLSAPMLLDQAESTSTTSAPSSAYIKSKIDDINSRINSLNTVISDWTSDVGQIDTLVNNWADLRNRIHEPDGGKWYLRQYSNTKTRNIISITMNNVNTTHHRLFCFGDSNNIGFIAFLCGSTPAYVGPSNIFSKTGADNATMQYNFKLDFWSDLFVLSPCPVEFPTPERFYTVSYTAW